MSSMRDDIYNKEKEIHEIKNQIKDLNLNCNKEIENKNIMSNLLTRNLEKIDEDKQL